jgi:hypothetical protein
VGARSRRPHRAGGHVQRHLQLTQTYLTPLDRPVYPHPGQGGDPVRSRQGMRALDTQRRTEPHRPTLPRAGRGGGCRSPHFVDAAVCTGQFATRPAPPGQSGSLSPSATQSASPQAAQDAQSQQNDNGHSPQTHRRRERASNGLGPVAWLRNQGSQHAEQWRGTSEANTPQTAAGRGNRRRQGFFNAVRRCRHEGGFSQTSKNWQFHERQLLGHGARCTAAVPSCPSC